MTELVRVGEGHYTPMMEVPVEHRLAVRRVLRKIRQVTHRMVINGGGQADQSGGRGEETSQPARTPHPKYKGPGPCCQE